MFNFKNYFTRLEKILWVGSVLAVVISFLVFDRGNYTTLITSLIGVTSLIFLAKGNPIGQGLIVMFSLLYGLISYSFKYYGEMITYLGMTMPMAILALVSWLKNPYKGNKSQVAVNKIDRKEVGLMFLYSIVITIVFYYILAYFNTANLIWSTVSVTTSFIAVYLTFRRSPYYAIGYAVNDIVLIILWWLAALEDKSYYSVVVCFVIFLINDIYGYISWKKMEEVQKKI